MSLLEEKTPSKQFVMPKEIYTIISSLPSLILLPPTCHAMLFLTHTLPHTITHTHTHIYTHTHTHTHILQVGSMVVYLCSEDARQVTGSTLTIDGGWTTR